MHPIVRTILLASTSPRRRDLLESLGLHVRVVASNVDEGERPGHAPIELAQALAAAKADAVASREPLRPLLAADTVVDLDGVSLGKPRDAAEALATLKALGGRDHLVHTAFVLLAGERRVEHVSTTRVWFERLARPELEAYVAGGDPFDKAGAYGIQGPGAALVARIEGDFYTVMGLPLGEVVRSLRRLGYALPGLPR